MLFLEESAQPAQNDRELRSQEELKRIASAAAAVLRPQPVPRYRSRRIQSFDFGPSGLEIALAIGFFPVMVLVPAGIAFWGW